MFSHKLSWKKRYFCGLDKKDNFWCSKIAFHESLFVFLHRPQKIFVLHKILCANIECSDVHPELFFIIF
jgi:hypothetical protein